MLSVAWRRLHWWQQQRCSCCAGGATSSRRGKHHHPPCCCSLPLRFQGPAAGRGKAPLAHVGGCAACSVRCVFDPVGFQRPGGAVERLPFCCRPCVLCRRALSGWQGCGGCGAGADAGPMGRPGAVREHARLGGGEVRRMPAFADVCSAVGAAAAAAVFLSSSCRAAAPGSRRAIVTACALCHAAVSCPAPAGGCERERHFLCAGA